MTTLLSAMTVLAGVVLLVLAVSIFFRQRKRIATWELAQGEVTELIPVRAQGEYLWTKTEKGMKVRRKYRYRPVVRFKPHKGRTVTFTSGPSSRPAPYAAGDKVKVFYNPDNPAEAQINSFVTLWFSTLMLAFFGLFCLGMGSLGLLMAGLFGQS